MFTECKPPPRERAGQLRAGSSKSHSHGGDGALLCTSPLQLPDYKREGGWPSRRGSTEVSIPHRGSKSQVGSEVVFLKIQRAGSMKDRRLKVGDLGIGWG